MQYKICPYCEAHLDFGECCDCQDKKERPPRCNGNGPRPKHLMLV